LLVEAMLSGGGQRITAAQHRNAAQRNPENILRQIIDCELI